MRDIPKGLLAVLTASIVLTVLTVLMGSPDKPVIGWMVHFVSGIVVYGVAIAVLHSKRPGTRRVGRGVMLDLAHPTRTCREN